MSKELQDKINHAVEAAQVVLDELLQEIEEDN